LVFFNPESQQNIVGPSFPYFSPLNEKAFFPGAKNINRCLKNDFIFG